MHTETRLMVAAELDRLCRRAREIVAVAERDGVTIDDGCVVDLLLDGIPTLPSSTAARALLVLSGLDARFPRAAHHKRWISADTPSQITLQYEHDHQSVTLYRVADQHPSYKTHDLYRRSRTQRAEGSTARGEPEVLIRHGRRA